MFSVLLLTLLLAVLVVVVVQPEQKYTDVYLLEHTPASANELSPLLHPRKLADILGT